MNLLAALLVLAALATIAGAGLYVFRLQARRRRGDEVIDPARLGADRLGEAATLLQFSNDSCPRCPHAHQTLASVADARTGVRHLDIDLTHRPDIARHFHVLQKPTTLVVDRHGIVQTRFGGVPNREVVELELTRLTGKAAS